MKIALTPIAVVKDASDVLNNEPAENTANLVKGAGENMADAFDDLSDGDLI